MAKVGWMQALTWAIQQDLLSVESAQAIAIVANSAQPPEGQEVTFPVQQDKRPQSRSKTAGA